MSTIEKHDMTQGKILLPLVSFTIPLVLGNLFQLTYNAADSSLLNFFSTAEGVHSYMIWGMGNFGRVSLQQLPFFSLVTAAGLLITILPVSYTHLFTKYCPLSPRIASSAILPR